MIIDKTDNISTKLSMKLITAKIGPGRSVVVCMPAVPSWVPAVVIPPWTPPPLYTWEYARPGNRIQNNTALRRTVLVAVVNFEVALRRTRSWLRFKPEKNKLNGANFI